MQQRQCAAQRRKRWFPSAWHKGLLLGVLFILMSLCHGMVAPVEASTASNGTVAVAVADEEQSPFRDCAASKRLFALSDRRGSATTFDLPAAPLGLMAHVAEPAPGLQATPPPLPGTHRSFLQVFRI